jgi:hypothetical protein
LALYAADGSLNVTVVDGSTLTGLYAANGSYNVVEVDGITLTGLYHPCGAYNVYVASADWTGGSIHPCGALVVSTTPYYKNTNKITAVSGTLGGVDVALVLTWTSGTGTLTPTFTLSGAIEEGDAITLSIYSDAGLTTLVDSDVNVVEAAEVLAGTLDFPGIGALPAGAYWAVATLAATGRSGTSNTETKTLVSFTPDDLFAGGEKGFWLDASDLSTLWQDTAGTSAVTADGQTVKRWTDKSGQSHAFTEATNGPLYKTDGSKHWLLFDGTNDKLGEGASNMTNAISAMTVWVAINATADATNKRIFGVLSSSFTFRTLMLLTGSEFLRVYSARVDGDAADSIIASASSSGADKIVIAELDFANNDAFIYDSTTTLNSNTSFWSSGAGNTNASNHSELRISSDAGDEPFDGRIYQMLVINRLLTAGEKTNLGAYFATKSGATY